MKISFLNLETDDIAKIAKRDKQVEHQSGMVRPDIKTDVQ